MNGILLFPLTVLLSAGVCAENIPERRKETVPAPAQVRSGTPGPGEAAVRMKIPAAEAPEASASIEELKRKQGQAVAELKKKQREELSRMKERLKSAYKRETRGAMEAKKREHQEALRFLRDAQKKEMEQFKKDRTETLNHSKAAAQTGETVPADERKAGE